MKILRKIIQKFVNKVRFWLFKKKQRSYARKVRDNQPIIYRLSNDIIISLYPAGQVAELLFTTDFERTELEQVRGYLKPGMVVLDIGANIGIYSLLADKMVGSAGHVFAFEPSSDNYSRLLSNIKLNMSSTITVSKIALADINDRTTKLRRDPGLGDSERYLDFQKGEKFKRGKEENDSGDSETVHVTTLDKYLFENMPEPRRIDFIKMDVEGSELSVFKGAVQTLNKNQDVMIFFECAPLTCKRAGVSTEEVFDYLRSLGFEIYCWDKECADWVSNPVLINSIGNVWACRNREMLPKCSSVGKR